MHRMKWKFATKQLKIEIRYISLEWVHPLAKRRKAPATSTSSGVKASSPSESTDSNDSSVNDQPFQAPRDAAKSNPGSPEMDDMSTVIGYTREGRPITVGASYLMRFAAATKLLE